MGPRTGPNEAVFDTRWLLTWSMVIIDKRIYRAHSAGSWFISGDVASALAAVFWLGYQNWCGHLGASLDRDFASPGLLGVRWDGADLSDLPLLTRRTMDQAAEHNSGAWTRTRRSTSGRRGARRKKSSKKPCSREEPTKGQCTPGMAYRQVGDAIHRAGG